MKQTSIWTKDFFTISFINFIIYLVYYLLIVIIAEYSMTEIGASPSQAGLASGIFIIGALIARMLTGIKINQYGEKKVLLIGLIIYSFMGLGYFFAHQIFSLLLVRFIHGFGFGIASVATGTMVAKIIPANKRGEGIGFYTLSTTLASAVGPLLGIFLIHRYSFNHLIGLAVSVLLLALIATLVTKFSLPTKHSSEMPQTKKHHFFEKKVLLISFVGACMGIAYSSIVSFISPYTADINLSKAGSLFFIVYSLAILCSRPIAGYIMDRYNENIIMIPSFLLFSLGLYVFSAANSAVAIFVAAAFIGIGFGTFFSSSQTIAIKSVSEERIGLATSTFLAIMDIGVGVGPFVLGGLVTMTGYRNIYLLMALLILVILAFYLIFNKKILNK